MPVPLDGIDFGVWYREVGWLLEFRSHSEEFLLDRTDEELDAIVEDVRQWSKYRQKAKQTCPLLG